MNVLVYERLSSPAGSATPSIVHRYPLYGAPSPPDGVTETTVGSPGRGGSGLTLIVPPTPGPTVTVSVSLADPQTKSTVTETVWLPVVVKVVVSVAVRSCDGCGGCGVPSTTKR